MKVKVNCKDCIYSEESQGSWFCRFNPPLVFPVARQNPLSQKIENAFLNMFPSCPQDMAGCGQWDTNEDEVFWKNNKVIS